MTSILKRIKSAFAVKEMTERELKEYLNESVQGKLLSREIDNK